MLAARSAKPKLSLSISTAASTRPSLSLKSPMALAPPRTPISPSPISPTARNTRLNTRGFVSAVSSQTSYGYVNSSSAKSILKKGHSSGSTSKQLKFSGEPTVYCVTPVAEVDRDGYYGKHTKMSRDERRWGRGH